MTTLIYEWLLVTLREIW